MIYKSFLEEAKKLFTKKMNFVVLFILPLATVLMMGVELDDEVISNIPMAVIDQDESAFSRQLIKAFDDNDTFDVVSYPETEGAMETMMKNSTVRVGMVIPKDFYKDIAALNSPSVLMVYDGSHMSITSAAKSKAVEILLTYKAGASVKQLSGRLGINEDAALNIARVFKFENRFLYNPSKSFEDFLAPILMAGYVQAAIALVATLAIDHRIYQWDNRKRLGHGTGKIFFYTFASVISYLMCVWVQVGIFDMPFKGNIGPLILLTTGLCFAVSSFSVMVSALFRNRMVALIAGGVLFIPNSVMAGTTWPLNAMPIGYQGFANYLPFVHFASNLRDVYLKGSGLDQFGGNVAYMFIFGGVVLLITELVLVIANREPGEEADHDLSGNVQDPVQVHL